MTGTDPPAVDVRRLTAAMRAAGLDVAGRLRLSRVGLGQSNLTYRAVDEHGQRWVVRRPPLGELPASAHDLEREQRIMSALAPTPVPVPVVHCCLPRGAVADVPVVVMEDVQGRALDGFREVGRLDRPARAALVAGMSDVLAAVHAVDLRETGLDSLASHATYAPRQLRRWSAQWAWSRTRPSPTLDDLTELLRRTAPGPSELCLLHGDLSPHNLLVDTGTGTVTAVLDWELSTLGDPLADVGTVLAYWTLADLSDVSPPAGGNGDGPAVGAASGRDTFLQGYLRTSGRAGTRVAYWHALALWRLAIITAGVLRRAVDEPRNTGTRRVPDPADVDRLAQAAWTVARTAGLA